jgi:hypothetical protein
VNDVHGHHGRDVYLAASIWLLHDVAASDGPGHRVAPPYGDDFIVISTRTPQVVVATLSGLLPSAVRTMPVR